MIMTKTPMMTPIIPRFISPPLIRVLTRSFRSGRWTGTVADVGVRAARKRGPDPAPSTTQPPQGRMHYTPREVFKSRYMEPTSSTPLIAALVNNFIIFSHPEVVAQLVLGDASAPRLDVPKSRGHSKESRIASRPVPDR
jgi:hypothetical protein